MTTSTGILERARAARAEQLEEFRTAANVMAENLTDHLSGKLMQVLDLEVHPSIEDMVWSISPDQDLEAAFGPKNSDSIAEVVYDFRAQLEDKGIRARCERRCQWAEESSTDFETTFEVQHKGQWLPFESLAELGAAIS